MPNVHWLADDLKILLDRFREARRTYPGMQSQLARLPEDGECWGVAGWLHVDTFASIKEDWHSRDWTATVRPSVGFFYIRPESACLLRGIGAWWDLADAVALFGQLAMTTVSTLVLHPALKAMVEQFWPMHDERAWIAWLHKSAGKWGSEELAISCWRTLMEEPELHCERRQIDVSHVDDVFAASCLLLGEVIEAVGQHSAGPPEEQPQSPEAMAIVVSLNPPQIKLFDTVYAVTPDGASFVQSLINAKGDWLAGSTLEMRADRVKASLPEPIRSRIESSPGKGYRLHREP